MPFCMQFKSIQQAKIVLIRCLVKYLDNFTFRKFHIKNAEVSSYKDIVKKIDISYV